MNKSPIYLKFLCWFLLLVGGASAAINTSLTADAFKSSHSIGGVQTIGLGLFLALVFTAIEAVAGHVVSAFDSWKDLGHFIGDQWRKGAIAQVWLVFIIAMALMVLGHVYHIDTVTTFDVLEKAGVPDDWAASLSVMLVFCFELCLITSRWVDRQHKQALRQSLEKRQSVDADIEYHRSRRHASLRTAKELGARNGYNEAAERYAKSLEGK